jgi:hypothetical protein
MMRQMIGVGATVAVLVFSAHFALYLTAARSEDRFTEYFNGAPDSPEPWSPANWDVIVHARSDDNTNTMHADHDAACGAPPGTHLITSLSEAVFLCRDHLMTAVNSSSSGYAVAYITPAAMTDWSDSPATISFDVSTARSTKRDWIDLWLTPWDQNMVLPLDPWLPDLNGPPDKALHFRLGNKFGWEIYQWPGEIKLSRNDWQNLPVPYSRLQRDTFTIKIGGGQIEMSYRNNATGMVRIFEKVPLPANLGFDRAVSTDRSPLIYSRQTV